MNASPTIRRIIGISLVLLSAGVISSLYVWGSTTAYGVLGGGAVMFLSFLGGGWAIHRAGQAASMGAGRAATGLVLLKLPVLGCALWMLFQRFEPVAVVAGGSVVLLSIVLSAMVQIALPVGEEA